MFKLERVNGQPVSDEELLEDLRIVAKTAGANRLSGKQYDDSGKYSFSTVARRFGTWNEALRKANLEVSSEIYIPEEELFENILRLWQFHGRQPRRKDLEEAPSTFSQSPYNRTFGSWTKSLETFVQYVNEIGVEFKESVSALDSSPNRTRDPSLRLRWKVLQRDHFTCRACGRSPATSADVQLHVDHIVPWSKGGRTEYENLQSLCSKCNLGKSNT